MSIQPRDATKTGIDSVTNRMKNSSISTGVDKSIKELSSIAKIMKGYVTSKEKSTDSPGIKTNSKICKVYGCIYKGTYNGIIDGLKEVANDRKKEESRDRKKDAVKGLVKSSAKLSLKTAKYAAMSPLIVAKGIAELFAFERSEFLNFFRAIYHGVGYGGSEMDYSQKAFRLQADNEHRRKKLLKERGGLSENDEIIELLRKISDSSEEQSKRDRGFIGKIIHLGGKRDSEQIELLSDIKDELISIDENTGGGRRRGFNLTNAFMNHTIKTVGILTGIVTSLGYLFRSDSSVTKSIIAQSQKDNTVLLEKSTEKLSEGADGLLKYSKIAFDGIKDGTIGLIKWIHESWGDYATQEFGATLLDDGAFSELLVHGIGDSLTAVIGGGLAMLMGKGLRGFAKGFRSTASLETELAQERNKLLIEIEKHTNLSADNSQNVIKKKTFGFGGKIETQIEILNDIRDGLVSKTEKKGWQRLNPFF
jgi:hypothetical protein